MEHWCVINIVISHLDIGSTATQQERELKQYLASKGLTERL